MYLIFLYFTTLYQIFPLYRIIRYSISEFSHNEGLIGPDAYFVISRADCNTSLKDIILDKCTLRWEKMYHPAIVIAYYLDSRYHDRDLTDEYPFSMIAEETSKFVDQDLSGQLVKELLWYNNKTGPFNSLIFWKLEAINNPIDW